MMNILHYVYCVLLRYIVKLWCDCEYYSCCPISPKCYDPSVSGLNILVVGGKPDRKRFIGYLTFAKKIFMCHVES